MAQVFNRDESGNVIDPPTNPDYERELTRARDSGDTTYIARVTQEYDDWRASEVERIEAAADGTVNTASDATNAGQAPGAEQPVTPAPAQTTVADTQPGSDHPPDSVADPNAPQIEATADQSRSVNQ